MDSINTVPQGTWVEAEVFRLVFARIGAVGGGSGQSLPAEIVRSIAEGRSAREMVMYFVGAAALLYGILRSQHGLALTTIRDSEPASESLGVDVFHTKLGVYVNSLGHLHRRHRWHRHDRGAGHQGHPVLRSGRIPRRLRNPVPDPSGPGCRGDHAQGAARSLGADRGTVRPPPVPCAPPRAG